MVVDNVAGCVTYEVSATEISLYSFGPINTSILNRAMVLYAEPDDFGQGHSKYSYYFGGNTQAIACCNITEFVIRSSDGRGLKDEELDEGV